MSRVVGPVKCAGHPSSVDALVAFDEDTVLSGCQDGMVRVIGVLPNAMLGVVGEHGDYPVESLALSGDGLWSLPDLLMSCQQRAHQSCRGREGPHASQAQGLTPGKLC